MSWINKTLTLSALPLALLGATAALAETIIVRSNGPSAKSYPPGKSLPANAKLPLKAGDSVVVLDSTGTRVLTGPGNFALAGKSTASASSVGQFLRNTGAKVGRTGATRGDTVTGPARSPNIWFVDVSKAGTMCVADPAAITLWRPLSAKAQTFTLTRMGAGQSSNIAFASGQSSRPWPVADLPVTDGAQYSLSGGGMTSPSTITIRASAPKVMSPESIGAVLIKNGCTAQTNLLVDTLAVPGEGGGAGG